MTKYSAKYVSTSPQVTRKQKVDAQGNPVVDEFGDPVYNEQTTRFPTLEKKINELSGDPKKQEVLRKAYQRFLHDNDVNASLTHDFISAADPKTLIKGTKDKTIEAISAIFHNSERFQREIMLMSGFELAYDANVAKYDKKTQRGGMNLDQAFEAAIQESKDLTAMSIGDFTRAGKPPVMTAPLPKIIFQFKQYSLIQTYNLIRNAFVAFKKAPGDDPQLQKDKKEAAKRLAGMITMTGLFGGLAAMPIYTFTTTAIEALSAIFMDEEDQIEDGESFINNILRQTVGNKGATVLMRGPLGQLSNIGVSERVSLDLVSLWMRDGGYQATYQDAFKEGLFNLAGPTISLAANAARAADLYNNYNPQAAVEAISPTIVRSALVAKRYIDSDYKATSVTKGTVIQEDLDNIDIFIKSIGFTPENVLQKQKAMIARKSAELKIQRRRQNILGGIFLGLYSDDQDTVDAAMEAVQVFNKKYPEYAITGDTIQSSILRRFKGVVEREVMGGTSINRTLYPRLIEEYPVP
jgi:hypothetical protein